MHFPLSLKTTRPNLPLPLMVIGVNANFLLKKDEGNISLFTHEILTRLTTQHPRHQFYFLFDRPYTGDVIFSTNVTPVVLSPVAENPFALKYWLDVKITKALKKYQITVFLSPDSSCSLRTKVPQCIVLHDTFLFDKSHVVKWSFRFFNKCFTLKFIKKASRIITISQALKTGIVQRYKTDPQKIDVVYVGAAEIFQPCSMEIKILIKQKYTDGREYFICTSRGYSNDVIINLLKAFSLFKKRQRSNWKLVITESSVIDNNQLFTLLQTYKYRDDVVLTGVVKETELAQLIAAAYAAVYPAVSDSFNTSLLQSMKCRVPCTTATSAAMEGVCKDAALYFDPANPTDIADKLMLLYKDETLHADLKEKGKLIASKYNWQSAADSIWESLEKASKH